MEASTSRNAQAPGSVEPKPGSSKQDVENEEDVPDLNAAEPNVPVVQATAPTSTPSAVDKLASGLGHLKFKSSDCEDEFLVAVSMWRVPVLVSILAFDIFCFTARVFTEVARHFYFNGGLERLQEMVPQFLNMILLYSLIALASRVSKRMGHVRAAKMEEVVLSATIGFAIFNLLMSLEGEKQDYVYACMFLTSATTILKIQWWLGSLLLGPSVLLAYYLNGLEGLKIDAIVHLAVGWGCGALLAYQSEWYRRQMYAEQCRAQEAHQKEMDEVQARIKVERELADAQTQAAWQNRWVEREIAANEAKSEFMRVMCHEVRTPLNGCLASAEMLLDTHLEDGQRDLAQTIRVCGSILLSTVSNFLDFFKMEAGRQLDIVCTEVNLPKILNDLHGIIEVMIGSNLEIDLQEPVFNDAPEIILSDPDRLRGIILNLYANAAKFTRKGFIKLEVSTTTENCLPSPDPKFSSVTLSPTYAQAEMQKLRKKLFGDRQSLKEQFSSQRMSVDIGEVGALSYAGSSGSSDSTMESMEMAGDTKEGGEKVKEEAAKKWLLFQVWDSGVGISDSGLHLLFKEYNQGSKEDTRRPRTRAGTGLGLSICSKQVGVLGGKIGAYSKLGEGSVFWFTVPLCTPDDMKTKTKRRRASWACELASTEEDPSDVTGWEPQGERDDAALLSKLSEECGKVPSEGQDTQSEGAAVVPREGTEGTTGPQVSSQEQGEGGSSTKEASFDATLLKGRRVLLAEDNIVNQTVARKMLASLGMQCDVASNGEEAVELVEDSVKSGNPFDVVLMDMAMPQMEGIEATRVLRNRGIDIPIIAMTANASDRDCEDCKAAGMNGFLAKPVLVKRLSEALLVVIFGKGWFSDHFLPLADL